MSRPGTIYQKYLFSTFLLPRTSAQPASRPLHTPPLSTASFSPFFPPLRRQAVEICPVSLTTSRLSQVLRSYLSTERRPSAAAQPRGDNRYLKPTAMADDGQRKLLLRSSCAPPPHLQHLTLFSFQTHPTFLTFSYPPLPVANADGKAPAGR